MLTADMVKKQARALGADLVGIGNIERWEGAPETRESSPTPALSVFFLPGPPAGGSPPDAGRPI